MNPLEMALLVMLLMLPLFSPATGTAAGPLAVRVENSAVLPFGPPDLISIGCGSILVGFQLPPCPSTAAVSASHPAHTTITELPIGGAGIGPTPYLQASSTSAFGTPGASSPVVVVAASMSTVDSVHESSTITVTTTAPPITVTQRVSQVIQESSSTVTGMCFVGDSTDGILVDCTKTLPAPIATVTAKSAAIRRAANPVKYFSSCNIYKLFTGKAAQTSSRRELGGANIFRRDVNNICAWMIVALVFCAVGTMVFFMLMADACRKWQAGIEVHRAMWWANFLLLALVAWILAVTVANWNHTC